MHTFKAISFVLLVEYFLNDNWHKLHCLAEEEVPDYLKLVARKKDSSSTSLRPTGAYKVSEQIQNIMKPLWNAHWKWLAEQEKQNASNHSSRSITDKKYLTSNIPTGMEDCKNRNIMESFHREACGIPKDTSVDITKSPDVLHVIPKSITVKRCGGECQNSKMSCVPIEAEKISVPVIELRFNTERGIFDQHCGMAYVEKHIRCRCECTLKPSNCSNKQKFVKDDCRCICRDDSNMKHCLSSNGKFWDNESCQCRCPTLNHRMCSTGFYYDLQSCRCVHDNELKTSSWLRNLIQIIRMKN